MPLTQSKAPDSLSADVRPISFTLHDTTISGPPETINLFVRPEDLSITSPSRMAITQTFGQDGAWADSFGPGVKTITLSGVTGWRGSRALGGAEDGHEHLQKIYTNVFKAWHDLRAEAVKAGNDPDRINLIFSDGLDRLTWVVAPQQFVLKRNKSRPLLAQYSITMHRLAGEMLEKPEVLSADDALPLAIKSLSGTATSLKDFVTSLSKSTSLLASIKEVVGKFVSMTGNLLRSVVAGVKALTGGVGGVLGDLIDIARGVAHAGMNLAHTIAAITTLPAQMRVMFGQLGSAYTNMLCVLSNIFKRRTLLPEYSIYGTGNCASTSGGRGASPYISVNTFDAITKSGTSSVAITKEAADAIGQMVRADPSVPGGLSLMMGSAGIAASGIFQ